MKRKLLTVIIAGLLVTGNMCDSIFSFHNAIFDMFVVSAAEETSGSCGENVVWKYDAESETLTISGNGEMVTPSSWHYGSNVQENVKTIIIEEGVTSIGNAAFSYCGQLSSVSIAESVTAIGNYAFNFCSNLTEVTLPTELTSIGTYGFSHCGMTDITIPGGSIGQYAFSDCPLTNVTLMEGVTAISGDAFLGCTKLTYMGHHPQQPSETTH